MVQDDQSDAPGAVDWAEVRRLYEDHSVPLRAIRERFGLTPYALRKAYIAGGWRRRAQIALPGPGQQRRPLEPQVLVRKFYRALEDRVIQLEEGTAAAAAATRPIVEEIQALARFARALEGVMREVRLSRQAGPKRTGRRTSEKPAVGGGSTDGQEARAADVAWMRAELKRRLDVLAEAQQGREAPPDRRNEGGAA